MTETKVKKTKIQRYQAALRSPVRGLWTGVLDRGQFRQSMFNTIETGIIDAWNEGAKECGIAPDELSEDELNTRDERIAQERSHVSEFGQAIQEGSRSNGGKLTPLLLRLDLWTNRYRDVNNEAKVMACKDQKLVWILGPTEHCLSCSRLAGRVKRGSFWESAGVRPQSPPNEKLICQGWNCQCVLNPTDARISRGPLPRVP